MTTHTAEPGRAEPEECPVCCCAYTGHKRRAVSCPYCAYAACTACVQTFLLASPNDASCMNCAAAWNREFLDSCLSRTFVHGALKVHRETVLLDREKALLPHSQQLLDNYKIARRLEENVVENERAVRRLRHRLAQTQRDITHDRARAARIVAGGYRSAGGLDSSESSSARRTFLRGCPVDGCRGFLSSAYKCGTCEARCCPHCTEPLLADEDHACDPDALASARLIARDSRACPGCASLIHKIDGCDQMWCVVCRTAFSWRTGQVVTSTVHNPHYYEWLRRTSGDEPPPRAPGDVVCGGLPGAWDLDFALRRAPGLNEPRRKFVTEFHRVVRHIQDIELRRLRTAFDADDNTDLRLAFLLHKIDETEWKRKLQQREKRRERDVAVRQIFEMYIAAATDSFNEMIAAREEGGTARTVLAAVNQLVLLTKYVDDQVGDVQRRFNMVVSGWNPMWARNLLRPAAEAAGFSMADSAASPRRD